MYFFRRKNIYRSGDNGRELYLIRWTLFACRYFSIKIHKILLSDNDDLHDHPWNFLSIILWGGYFEEIFLKDSLKEKGPSTDCRLNPCIYHRTDAQIEGMRTLFTYWRKPGSILWRPATMAHKLYLPPGKSAWTFVVTIHRHRDWGFWGKNGWVFHSDYTRDEVCD